MRKISIYLQMRPYGLIVLGILALATTLRVILISHSWPVVDSDEGTMGMMALHIAYHGATPVFFYGQNYMGALEAYIAAPMFLLFGPSAFALHFSLLFIYGCSLVVIYLLTSRVYTKRFALFLLIVFAFGSSEMFARQLTATGGYPESFFFEPLLLLYAFWLASSARDAPLEGKRRWRVLAYLGWVPIAGLAFWSDPLMAPFILVSGWLLLRFCSRELPWWPIAICVAACTLLVTITYEAYNQIPLSNAITATLRFIFRIQGNGFSIPPLTARIAGTLFVALPRATGLNVACYIANDGGGSGLPPQPLPAGCYIVSGMWGMGVLIALAISAFLAFQTFRALRHAARTQPWTQAQRDAAVRSFSQLMLIVGAALTLVAYVNSAAPGLDPWVSTRYLLGVSIALPAVLWPLWQMGQIGQIGQGAQRIGTSLFAKGLRIGSIGLLLAVLLTFLLGWIQTLNLIPAAQQQQQQDSALIQSLLKIGATRIYTDYWTCDRIAFESDEHIICSVVDERLQSGFNRYPAYAPIVTADPHAAWVFLANSQQARAISQKATNAPGHFRQIVQDGYAIYVPING